MVAHLLSNVALTDDVQSALLTAHVAASTSWHPSAAAIHRGAGAKKNEIEIEIETEIERERERYKDKDRGTSRTIYIKYADTEAEAETYVEWERDGQERQIQGGRSR